MGRATSTPKQKKTLKRAQQQRYRAKKRAMRNDQVAPLCPAEPPMAAIYPGTMKRIRSVDSTSLFGPTKQDKQNSRGWMLEPRPCLQISSYISAIRIILDPVRSNMAGDLATSTRCTPELLAAWLHHQVLPSPCQYPLRPGPLAPITTAMP